MYKIKKKYLGCVVHGNGKLKLDDKASQRDLKKLYELNHIAIYYEAKTTEKKNGKGMAKQQSTKDQKLSDTTTA